LNAELGSREAAFANARALLRRDPDAAAEQAREILAHDPDSAEGFRVLGLALRRAGKHAEASEAEQQAVQLALFEAPLVEAAMALAEGRIAVAERRLRDHLTEQPDDAAALHLLATVALRTGKAEAAQHLLASALAIAPAYREARDLANRLAALAATDAWVAAGPSAKNALLRDLLPDATASFQQLRALFERALATSPGNAEHWVSLGNVLRVLGEQRQTVDAFRRAIAVRPSYGEARWAIADLKTVQFTATDIAELRKLLDRTDLGPDDRIGLGFALGRALEQADAHKEAFDCYTSANALRHSTVDYQATVVTRHTTRSIELFDRAFFDQRSGWGEPSDDPIFILGLPRSGSTLLEQVLASHSRVEGTSELPDIPELAAHVAGAPTPGMKGTPYLSRLSKLTETEIRNLGRSYLWTTGMRRHTSRRRFIDKMPNNWLHLGMILTILPRARIIDARRDVLACGWSLFRQKFATGQEFSYDLVDIGNFAADNLRMMEHFDRLFPGRVHRVIYEDFIANPEAQLGSLLDYLDLPFEPGCLDFHRNPRAVRTSSSEQVRRPLNRDGIDGWRPYEKWLVPLRKAMESAGLPAL
jgi:cytochrome c-type biogenesis protein CcmH/NrfG